MNKRIEKIADMVNQGVIAADIGTDHAFLPILLIQKNRAEKVYACDLTEGPLKAARRNIEKQGLSDRITTILCDGFDGVPDDINCAVIAGMGFFTCTGILERAMDRLSKLEQIIVEVNRNTSDMRKWISDHRFTVDQEVLITERGFDYIAISFTAKDHDPLSEEELLCGTSLLKQQEGYAQYCDRQISKIENVLSHVREDDGRRTVLTRELAMWNQAKESANQE